MTMTTCTIQVRGSLHALVTPLLAGARAIAPSLLGLFPFGVAVGIATAGSPLDHLVGWATAPMLFAGSAHLSAVSLFAAGAGALTIVASVIALNARFALYGAMLARSFADQPGWFRYLGPYFIVDPLVAAVSETMAGPCPAEWRRRHYLGAAVTLWIVWVGSITIGMVAGPLVDPAWSLEFAAPLFLVALLVPKLSDRAARVAASVAAIVSAILVIGASALPPGGGVTLAMIAGAAVAILMPRSTR